METGFTCLMYHRLGSAPEGTILPGHYVEVHTFERQLRLLQKLKRPVVTLGAALQTLEDPQCVRPVLITFDDGYRSFSELGLPILRRYQMSALVFLVTGLIGKTSEWDEREGDVTEQLMNREQILATMSEGAEFGAHSHTHPRLWDIEPDAMQQEIAASLEGLRELRVEAPLSFCYPYGGYNGEVQAAVRETGFDCAFATSKGRNDSNTDRFALHRINVRRDTGAMGLMFKLMRERTKK
ncbi:MAG: polysaccharide deacetylase family protein [Fimbriimonadaceae bacterium]